MQELTEKDLRHIRGGSVLGIISGTIAIASAAYDFYRGYRDASKGE